MKDNRRRTLPQKRPKLPEVEDSDVERETLSNMEIEDHREAPTSKAMEIKSASKKYNVGYTETALASNQEEEQDDA